MIQKTETGPNFNEFWDLISLSSQVQMCLVYAAENTSKSTSEWLKQKHKSKV